MNDVTWRKLVKVSGARTDRYGPKLTMNVARANVARCPDTGRPVERGTDYFKRMEAHFAPR